MRTMGILEKPEPLRIEVFLDDYNELVKKAALYDELAAGRIAIMPEPRIVGGDRRE